MKLNWINVANKKPNDNEEVFVLFGNGRYNNPHDDDRPEIVVATWSEGIDDFVDARLQCQYSNYWMPICFHNQPERLSEETSKEDATV